jgi:hypothetical protein
MDPSKKSRSTPNVTAIPTELTTSSSLFPDLNKVLVPRQIKRHESLAIKQMEHDMQTEFLFTEQTFLERLHYYHSFDILTYSVMSFRVFRLHPIRRLIYGVGNPPLATKASVQLSHTHAKLWICYRDEKDNTPDVFVGSANATDMTILDLMVKVNSRQAKTLIGYFNLLWNINNEKK